MKKKTKMTNEKMREITARDVLIPEKNKCVEEMTKLDIDIYVLERTDPELVVAQKTLSRDSQGKPMSSQDIKAGKMLQDYRQKRAGYEQRLNAIEALLKKSK